MQVVMQTHRSWTKEHTRFFEKAVDSDWARASPECALLARALHCGVGAHHGGLPTPYRRAVEALFRGGHIHAILATGTLAQVRGSHTF